MTDKIRAVLITLEHESQDLYWEEFKDVDEAKKTQEDEEENKNILIIGDIKDVLIDL